MNKIKTFILILIMMIIFIPVNTYAADVTEEEIREYIMDQYQYHPYGIPYILQALIYKESRFDEKAVSKDGKNIGLTQLNPHFHPCDDPKDYRLNINTCGLYIYSKMQEGYEPEFVLMCWNCGEEKAKKLYEQGIITSYAKTILKNADILKEGGKIE